MGRIKVLIPDNAGVLEKEIMKHSAEVVDTGMREVLMDLDEYACNDDYDFYVNILFYEKEKVNNGR